MVVRGRRWGRGIEEKVRRSAGRVAQGMGNSPGWQRVLVDTVNESNGLPNHLDATSQHEASVVMAQIAALNFAVLGDPVAHSKSPRMHGAAFDALGLPHRYIACHVRPDDLSSAVAGAAALGFRGLNLTVPHKRAVLSEATQLSERVRRVGAANTLRFDGDGVSADNTDGRGFVAGYRELRERDPKVATILGTGGASVAIVDELLEQFSDLRVCWVTRDPTRVERIGPLTDPRVQLAGYETLSHGGSLGDLLVNATTVGMHGGPSQFPVELPLHGLGAEHTVIDVVYPRPAGGLLDLAQARGARVQDGRAMLLWQGVFALEWWLDQKLTQSTIQAMRTALA